MNIQMIPLNKLVPSPANVRKTGADTGIEELAASIAAHGLLQNLQVRPAAKGKFEVVAGGRRLAALKLLAKRKELAKERDRVPCARRRGRRRNQPRRKHRASADASRRPVRGVQGLGRRRQRRRGHRRPVRRQRRPWCGSVSSWPPSAPRLIALYRDDEMTLDQLMAFTVSGRSRGAGSGMVRCAGLAARARAAIRRTLTAAHVDADDRRARLRRPRCLSGGGRRHHPRPVPDREHEGYLTDPALLDRLAAAKLEARSRRRSRRRLEMGRDHAAPRLRDLRRIRARTARAVAA